MDKYSGVAQDSAGNLITTGTPTIRVTSALSDTLVPIYSSDSLSAAKANPFTLPTNGKIEFHARNGKVRVKMINGATETPIDEVVLFAGVTYSTLAARPAAGSADRLYIATDIGRAYYDNGTAWKDYPDYSLDAMEWYPADDIVAAATTDVFGGKGNFIEVTHASGVLAITALANANALEGSLRLVKFTVSGGTLSMTHNGTSLEITDGLNWTLSDGDMAWVIGKGGSSVRAIPLRRTDTATATEVRAGADTLKRVTPSALKSALLFSGGVETAEQAITNGTRTAVAHGLGAVPKLFQVVLRCKTAELGHAVGDELVLNVPYYNDSIGEFEYGAQASVDATNIIFIVSENGIKVYKGSATIGTQASITPANWKLVGRAWA